MAVIDDIDKAAELIAVTLSASGYHADFTPASAWEIDRFFHDQMDGPGRAKHRGLLGKQLGARLFAIGAYIGEVIRRNSPGWEWAEAPDDPEDEINVSLQRSPTDLIWPIQRAMKRYAEGDESGMAAYVASVAEVDVGTRPAVSSKRRWFDSRP